MKKEVKLFFITDFEKEEAYLADMHRRGWKLKAIWFFCLFLFEPCRPEEVAYRLDFKPNLGEDREIYHQLYVDYGWEYVCVCNNFAYFRKLRTVGEEADIYSDRQTKLEMIGRIFKRRFLLLVSMGVVIFWKALRSRGDFFSPVWIVLSIVYCFLIFYCGIGFYKLKNQYAKGELK